MFLCFIGIFAAEANGETAKKITVCGFLKNIHVSSKKDMKNIAWSQTKVALHSL